MNQMVKIEKTNTSTNSLEEITKAWGKWMDKQFPKGGGVKYTESTKYSNQSSLKEYHRYQTNVIDTQMSYDQHAPSPKPQAR